MKNFTESQVISILVECAMECMGEEWVPQDDDNFKMFLKRHNLLDVFNSKYDIDDESIIEDSYIYPLDELKDIVKTYLNDFIDESFKNKFQSSINAFMHNLLYKLNVPFDECRYANIAWNLNDEGTNIKLYPSNLFTACLLAGYYIPYKIVENKTEFIFPDNAFIKFDNELQMYVFNDNISIKI